MVLPGSLEIDNPITKCPGVYVFVKFSMSCDKIYRCPVSFEMVESVS